ncbi:MAG: M10 family metallopeptidase C-terminal domain-containing protein, partial [Pseudomonadota bacterium]
PIDGSGEPWQSGWKILTATQMDGIRSSLAAWAEVANVRFKEIMDSATVSGDIRFSALTGITDSKTYLPDLTPRGGDVWLAAADNLSTTSKGTYGYTAFLRETGHALGLDNPHEGQVIADPAIDALPFSVMSQRDFVGDTLGNKRDILYPTTLMLNDIAAIQYLYGANSNTRSSDTIYSWVPDQAIFETIWDGGGNDTIDWSAQITAAVIDLNAGAWSYLGPERWDGHASTNQNLAIAYNTVIENATGGTADDKLTGNSSSNFLSGGDGNDEMHGGSGADFFDWNGNLRNGNDVMYGGLGNDAFVMNTALDSVVELPDEGIDTIWSTETYSIADVANVENIYLFGSKPTDAKGNTLANELRGNDADNLLEGSKGNDILMGGAGRNKLDGGEGADTAVYLMAKDSYIITTIDPGWRIESSAGDIDNLDNIERLKFLDTNIAYDLDGNAGTVAKIIGAVFGKESLVRKDYVGIGLNLLDNGMSYAELMDLALNVKLGNGYSDAAEVSLLYANLIGGEPSNSDLNYWTSTISSGQFTQNSLAIMAADHEINATHIDLVGLAQTGIAYY